MQEISINGHKFTGPGSWEEMTTADLLQYARVLDCRALSEKQAKHQLVWRLFAIPYKYFRLVNESGKIQLHACLDWLHGQNSLSTWLIRRLRVGKNLLYGPEDRLADLTGEEFMFCEAAYEKWLQGDDEDLMDTLFAVLYREKGFLRRKRRAFDRERLDAGEKRAKSVRRFVKHAVMINYAGCRNLMIRLHPNIWRVAAAGCEGGSVITSWAALFLDLAGNKFGPYPDTIKTNIWLLLADMEKKAAIAREMEARG